MRPLDSWQVADKEVILPARLSSSEGRVILFRELPPAFQEAQTIFFWTQSSNATVWLEGVLIYRMDSSACGGNAKVAPSQWNKIDIPARCAGKRLELQLYSPYSLTAGYVQQVYYGPAAGVSIWMKDAYGLSTVLNWCIFLAGVVITSTALLTEKRFSAFWQRKMFLGTFAILLSLWLRLGTVGLPVNMQPCLRESLAHLVLLFVFIPLAAYVRCRLDGIWKKLFGGMTLAFTGCALVILTLQCAHVLDISQSIYAVLFLVGVFVALIFVFCIRCFVGFPSESNFALLDAVGVETIVMVVILEVANYFSDSGFSNMGEWMRSGMLPYVTFEGIFEIYKGRKRRLAIQRIETENDRLRLQLLLGQIKPHFVYNALGAIRELIREDPEAAYTALYDFSRYLRQHIETYDSMSKIDFSMELEHIRTYVALEKIRFGSMLEMKYDIRYTDFQIPPLTVQPFVENAIKHGIFHMENGGTVWLRTYKDQETACIVVQDNGVGFDVETTLIQTERKDSCGIRNAKQRLHELGGAECSIRSGPGEGTTVCIYVALNKGNHRETMNEI